MLSIRNIPRIKLSGINVTAFTSIEEAVDNILSCKNISSYSTVAINPEKIISAIKDPKLQAILQSNEIAYPDGIGVVKLLERKSGIKVVRIPGCELWEALMKAAGEKSIPVYLVGASSSVLDKTVNKLKQEYSTPVVGFSDGYFKDEDKLIADIKQSGAKIVTVAMGSPKQELFINKCKEDKIPAFFMGVGGTYDVYTGNVKRAPKIFCDLNLEWLYRLLSQPTRIKRQLNLLHFLWLAIRKKL